jgi:hypothetical protein
MFWITEKPLAIAGILQLVPNEYTTRQAKIPIHMPVSTNMLHLTGN